MQIAGSLLVKNICWENAYVPTEMGSPLQPNMSEGLQCYFLMCFFMYYKCTEFSLIHNFVTWKKNRNFEHREICCMHMICWRITSTFFHIFYCMDFCNFLPVRRKESVHSWVLCALMSPLLRNPAEVESFQPVV